MAIVRRGVSLLAAIASLWLGGCAVRPVTPERAKFEPDDGYRWSMRHDLPDNDPQTLLVLTFSGGGTRAAAFSYGVLEELRRTVVHTPRGAHPALAEVDVITGTSGGSFTALAYALYGERLFDDYDRKFLKRDVEGDLLRRLFNPFTWPRVLSQGFGRSELAAEYYDEILFHGATYADLLAKPTPKAIVGATDVSTGTRVDFSQLGFDVICADLSKFRLSRAAAASSAVPILLSPVTLDNRGGTCGYRPPAWVAEALRRPDPLPGGNRATLRFREMERRQNSQERPYLHLVDGGLSDNLALYGPVDMLQALLASPQMRGAAGIGGLRRVAVVVVNARSAPRFDFDKVPYGPGNLALLSQSISVPMNNYSTEGIAALEDIITQWEQQVQLDADARRLGEGTKAEYPLPPVEFSVVDVSFDAVADPQLREYLENLPTSFALSEEAVDRLRASAAQLLRDSPAFRSFVGALSRPRRRRRGEAAPSRLERSNREVRKCDTNERTHPIWRRARNRRPARAARRLDPAGRPVVEVLAHAVPVAAERRWQARLRTARHRWRQRQRQHRREQHSRQPRFRVHAQRRSAQGPVADRHRRDLPRSVERRQRGPQRRPTPALGGSTSPPARSTPARAPISRGGSWTMAGGYAAVQDPCASLDVIGGFRYLGLSTTTNWQLTTTVTGTGPGGTTASFPQSGSVEKSENVWAAIVGAKGRMKLGKSDWFVNYYADIGGWVLHLHLAGRRGHRVRVQVERGPVRLPLSLLQPERRQADRQHQLRRLRAGRELPVLKGPQQGVQMRFEPGSIPRPEGAASFRAVPAFVPIGRHIMVGSSPRSDTRPSGAYPAEIPVSRRIRRRDDSRRVPRWPTQPATRRRVDVAAFVPADSLSKA